MAVLSQLWLGIRRLEVAMTTIFIVSVVGGALLAVGMALAACWISEASDEAIPVEDDEQVRKDCAASYRQKRQD
jgi:hypothetical protein